MSEREHDRLRARRPTVEHDSVFAPAEGRPSRSSVHEVEDWCGHYEVLWSDHCALFARILPDEHVSTSPAGTCARTSAPPTQDAGLAMARTRVEIPRRAAHRRRPGRRADVARGGTTATRGSTRPHLPGSLRPTTRTAPGDLQEHARRQPATTLRHRLAAGTMLRASPWTRPVSALAQPIHGHGRVDGLVRDIHTACDGGIR